MSFFCCCHNQPSCNNMKWKESIDIPCWASKNISEISELCFIGVDPCLLHLQKSTNLYRRIDTWNFLSPPGGGNIPNINITFTKTSHFFFTRWFYIFFYLLTLSLTSRFLTLTSDAGWARRFLRGFGTLRRVQLDLDALTRRKNWSKLVGGWAPASLRFLRDSKLMCMILLSQISN